MAEHVSAGMMSNLFKPILEIKSKNGELHFRRWSIISTPWFSIYIHRIFKADRDGHLHDHPWSFLSIVLSGHYWFTSKHIKKDGPITRTIDESSKRGFGSIVYIPAENYYHKITAVYGVVTSIAIVGRRHHEWGYYVNGKLVPAREYRKMKNAGTFN